MKISIAMATYNGEMHILEQLKSFLRQTMLPDEIIVFDDCSSDRTVNIIKQFSMSAPFKITHCVNERNVGYAENFNRALLQTTGDLVFLSDQDDVWHKEKIETIATIAEENPKTLLFINNAELTNADLVPTGVTKLEQLRAAGFRDKSFVMGCCIAVKRELLEICLPIPQGFGSHDTWLSEIAEGLGGKLIISDVLQYYRRHESNESINVFNLTTRLNRFTVFLVALQMFNKATFNKNTKISKIKKQSHSKLPMLKWAEAAINSAPPEYTHKILIFISSLKKQVQAQRERDAIIRNAFPTRAVLALNYWFKGGYSNFSGINSFLRDLLGK